MVTYDPPTRPCAKSPAKGTVAIVNHWGAVTGLPNYGILNCRPVSGTSSPSAHGNGRAGDLGADARNDNHRAKADHFCRFLIWACNELGIQFIIWNKRKKRLWLNRGWEPYYGRSNHTDHIHFEQNEWGSKKVTTELVQELWHIFVFTVEAAPGMPPATIPEEGDKVIDPLPQPTIVSVGVEVLELDSAGGFVVTLQTLLNQKGQAGLAIDGHFGVKTQNAVSNWQRILGLNPNGKAESTVWETLLSLQV